MLGEVSACLQVESVDKQIYQEAEGAADRLKVIRGLILGIAIGLMLWFVVIWLVRHFVSPKGSEVDPIGWTGTGVT